MGPVRLNPIQRTVRSVHVCALHCAQLLRTILHRTDLIIFPLTLQTITIALCSKPHHTTPQLFYGPFSGTTWVSWWMVDATPSGLTSAHLHHPRFPIFTGRMPFLLPNQQCQSTEVPKSHKIFSFGFPRPHSWTDGVKFGMRGNRLLHAIFHPISAVSCPCRA